MKFSIIEKGLQVANRSLLVLKKHSPEILTGAGIAGGIVAAVIAAKATLELEENTQYGRNLVGGHKKLREDKSEEDYPTQVVDFRRNAGLTRDGGAVERGLRFIQHDLVILAGLVAERQAAVGQTLGGVVHQTAAYVFSEVVRIELVDVHHAAQRKPPGG